jgi:hypothetical protein
MAAPPASAGAVHATLTFVLEAGFVVAIAVGSVETVAAMMASTAESAERPCTLLAE